VFIAKILVFVAVVDVAVLPILWILKVALPQAYISITCYEGFCITLIGGLLLFTSLFSTAEQENHKYSGLGTYRYELRSKERTKKEKSSLRQKGILMIITGMLLFLLGLVGILNI